MSKRLVAVLVLMTFVVAFSGVAIYGVGLGNIVKLFGIGFAVSKFGGQINSFINTLLGQKGIKWEGATKVVPIISLGRGLYVGAAQVAGAPEVVKKTKAVGQGETRIGGLRGKLLIPMATKSGKGGISRIKGVGVTAIIDFKI